MCVCVYVCVCVFNRPELCEREIKIAIIYMVVLVNVRLQ